MRYNERMKKQFDDLTDLVEHAQNANPPAAQSPVQGERQVENAMGEKITLGEKGHPQQF